MAGKEKTKGYIIIKPNELRVQVNEDCLVLEQKVSTSKEKVEIIYGNYKYYTSWDSLLSKLVRIFVAEKISKKKTVNFQDARKEYLSAINELKNILIGEIDDTFKKASEEIKQSIIKFNC